MNCASFIVAETFRIKVGRDASAVPTAVGSRSQRRMNSDLTRGLCKKGKADGDRGAWLLGQAGAQESPELVDDRVAPEIESGGFFVFKQKRFLSK